MGKDRLARTWLEGHRVSLAPLGRDAIIGLTHVMAELDSLVGRLEDHERARLLGAEPPKGVLFYGPPGVGKTLVARYLSGTLGAAVPLYEVSSDELTPDRLRGALRELATRGTRSVLYLDEIDQWALHRGDHHAHSPRTRLLLTAALAALDGLVPTTGPLVIASSNRSPAVLDPALVRSGRLGIHVHFDLPDEAERARLFAHFLVGRPIDGRPDTDRLARLTRGSSPADIRGMVDDAAGLALAAGRHAIADADLVAAVRRRGDVDPETALDDPERRRRSAVHEAGHVAACVRLRGPDWVYAVRLTAEGGQTDYGEEGVEIGERGDADARDAFIVALAGSVAEAAVLGEPSLGSSHDIAQVTALALARLASGLEPAFPPISLDALGVHVPETLRTAALAAITPVLVSAGDVAVRIVRDAHEPIRRFAGILERAGELAGADLVAAIEAAGFPGPQARTEAGEP